MLFEPFLCVQSGTVEYLTLLCNWSPELCLAKPQLYPHYTLTAHSRPPPLVTSMLLPVAMNWMILTAPRKWNHTVFALRVWLISLSVLSSGFIPVVAWVSVPSFSRLSYVLVWRLHIHPLTHCWAYGFLPPFGCWE